MESSSFTRCSSSAPRYSAFGLAATLLWAAAMCAIACAAESPNDRSVRARHAMVVSVSKPASEIGVRTLKGGGNAVDAAIATAMALAVTYPEAGNIGGGGFMMVLPQPGAVVVCIDYREFAPAAAHENMLEHQKSRLGHRMVAVPGTMRGLALAHKKYGKLPWRTLVSPAVQLAHGGFEIDAAVASSLNRVLASSAAFEELRRVYGHPVGRPWQAGDRLAQPELAQTLDILSRDGPDAFYTGRVAQQLVAEMRAGGGLIAADDLARYQAKERAPVHGVFRGYDIFAPPPPSSGGIALVQMLGLLEHFELEKLGRWSPRTLHLMAEAMRRAYCDRARHLGDQDFVPIPDYLTSARYTRELAEKIDPQRATRSDVLASDIRLADEGSSTTHFSIVDAQGMCVSNTYTLERRYGSRIVVRGAGFLLNNQMGDFNWRPGRTDRKGAIGTPANRIAPGKRMLSCQTPVIVTRGGRLVLATGSPGGRTIMNTMLCVLLNVLEFKMPLDEAVTAPRQHHQWLPDRLLVEQGSAEHEASLSALRAMGHRVRRPPEPQGDVHSIWLDGDGLWGVADGRISGHAAGY